jgi:hypothetical protein
MKKLVLRGFSQDVDLQTPDESENYLIIEEEATGAVHRLPVPLETVSKLAELALEESETTPAQPQPEEVEEAPEDLPEEDPGEGEPEEEEPEEEEQMAPPTSTPPVRRQVPQPQRAPATPTSEDEVPSL